MKNIRGKDTQIEIILRKALWAKGYRYRKNYKKLPGNPDIVLADEPSGNLDTHNRREIHNLFFRLREELGQTTIIVTHDEGLASMADRKITMRDGIIL